MGLEGGWYNSSDADGPGGNGPPSGAYIFRPNGYYGPKRSHSLTTVTVEGPVLTEIRQVNLHENVKARIHQAAACVMSPQARKDFLLIFVIVFYCFIIVFSFKVSSPARNFRTVEPRIFRATCQYWYASLPPEYALSEYAYSQILLLFLQFRNTFFGSASEGRRASRKSVRHFCAPCDLRKRTRPYDLP
jgi:hypothetical protein